MSAGGFDLDRFIRAQAGGVHERAVAELRAGRKRTHWMWFVFPQLAALGRSDTARFYGLSGLEEAWAYLAHPLLGARLRDAVQAALDSPEPSPDALFGFPDTLKFRSCLSLFAAADSEEPMFAAALARFYAGEPDPLTVEALGAANSSGRP